MPRAIWLDGGLLQGIVTMPHKYEREIEEILRNMERTEPRRTFGDRVRAFQRPAPSRQRGRSLSLNSTLLEVLLAIGAALVLAGAGLTYYLGGAFGTDSLIAGIIATVGFACILVAVVIGWWARFRGVSIAPRRASEPVESNITSLGARRGPLADLRTTLRILRLKWRYQRRREEE